MFNSIAEAQRVSGKISTSNTKMPGSSYAVDPFQCKTGSKLAEIEGTVCSKCYARRIAAFRPSVAKGYKANWDKLHSSSTEDWIDGMVMQIQKAYEKTGEPYHRWFDAGDVPDVRTLEAIAEVARRTPEIYHWLPTKEASILSSYKQKHMLPSNLIVRLSGPKINGTAPISHLHTSTVHTAGTRVLGTECLAYTTGNSCGTCRACWDRTVKNVSYKVH